MRIKDLSEKLKQRALNNQQLQGNKENENIPLCRSREFGGFNWDSSPEGWDFWHDVNHGIVNKDRIDRNHQVGGSHYSKYKIQVMDIIDEYGLDFYEGNALKYLLRYKDKNGKEDLLKCQHYLQILINRQDED